MNPSSSFSEIPSEQLDQVSGGRAQPHTSGGLFGWFDSIYKGVVNHFAAHIGGNQLAEKMYGKHVTASDRARSEAAMKKFLVAGNKLPKGVPNIFG